MEHKKKIAFIGATGFIGSNVLQYLLKRKNVSIADVTVVVRRTPELSFPEGVHIVQCDHLDFQKLKSVLAEADIIFDTAGLAWQHPQELAGHGLFVEEVVQNAVSAYIIAKILRKDQTLVWTSTSAIDTMFAHIKNKKKFKQQVERLITTLLHYLDGGAQKAENFRRYFPLVLKYSYPFSKFLGQQILERLSQGNIKVLKLSDVYGPGQDISQRIIDPNVPARRIQRFISMYRYIVKGKTDWMPRHGFSKTKNGEIIHEVRNDDVFPTYIDDVCEMITLAPELQNVGKTIFEVSGNRITNYEMAKTIRDFFKIDVRIKTQETMFPHVEERSKDLKYFGFSRELLTPFKDGLQKWLHSVE